MKKSINKQKEHLRLVRTKRGKKLVTVNKGLRKRKAKKKVVPIIQPKEKKIFRTLSDYDYFNKEYGGGIDFDLDGKIEQININPGTKNEVIILDSDYELFFHTHPKSYPPSVQDVVSVIDNDKQQGEIIFSKNLIFITIKTPETPKPSSKLFRRIIKDHKELVKKTKPFKDGKINPQYTLAWLDYIKNELKLKVVIKKNDAKRLRVPITPVEPPDYWKGVKDFINNIF